MSGWTLINADLCSGLNREKMSLRKHKSSNTLNKVGCKRELQSQNVLYGRAVVV